MSGHIPNPILVVIIGGYIIFVLQLIIQTDWKKTHSEDVMPMLWLVSVFIFCDLSGYVSPLIPDSFEHKDTIRVVLHFMLAIFTTLLVITNQAKKIGRTLMK